MDFYSKKIKDVEKELDTDIKYGLSSKEAEKRLSHYGKNEICEAKRKSRIILFLEQFHSPVIYILIGAVIISSFIGELIDSIVILFILILNAVLGYIQESKAEKAIEALKKLSSLKSIIIREGKEVEINSKDLVPGDIILLETGNKIPADCRLIECHNFETQESALTGESMPVKKTSEVIQSSAILADHINCVFSGTIVTIGRARAIVTETGMRTEIGRIANLIQQTKIELTPLQKNMKVLARRLGIIVLAICIIVFVSGIIKGGNILEILIVSVSLAVAAIPEGLPAIITISLAVGVQRMIKHNALIRKMPSVETLGSTTIICTDKTGTLTKNEMTVTKIYANGNVIDVSGSGYIPQGDFFHNNKKIDPKDIELLLKIGALNNDSKFEDNKIIGDPTEGSLLVSAMKGSLNIGSINRQHLRIDEIPFTPERKMMSTIHKIKGKKVLYCKGAAEIIIENCGRIYIDGKVRKITKNDKIQIINAGNKFANSALRVLAFAYNDNINEKNLIFVGLQAMIDPPREGIIDAIKKCNTAGMKVVMITGDNEETAKAIAKQIGLGARYITGKELEKIKDLDKIIEDIHIFARVNPEHKLKIIDALKKKGHVTAMTGDGINDAPALKKADIGIAMGLTGTDVSKEASAMVLTDDNFASIVNAVEEGRGIYGNIRKFFAYFIAGNISEVLIVFFGILFGWPLPLTATQILLINLVTEGLPAITLSIDPYEPNSMSRKPRKSNEPIYKNMNAFILYGPAIMTVLGLFVFYYFNFIKGNYQQAQTATFLTISMFGIYNAFVCRSIIYPTMKVGIFKNKYLIFAVTISFFIIISAIFIPAIGRFFKMVPLSIFEFITILLISSIGAIIIELSKIYKNPSE